MIVNFFYKLSALAIISSILCGCSRNLEGTKWKLDGRKWDSSLHLKKGGKFSLRVVLKDGGVEEMNGEWKVTNNLIVFDPFIFLAEFDRSEWRQAPQRVSQAQGVIEWSAIVIRDDVPYVYVREK